MNQILIIDDDIPVGNMLEEVLGREGYKVLRAYSGTEALLLLSAGQPDLVLLDLMLPGLSGEEILPRLAGIPVIVLSARADTGSKVKLLLEGAADYMTKPFDTKELLARIVAALRKAASPACTALHFSDLTLDTASHTVRAKQEEVRLTRTEYAILRLLMQNPSQIITKSLLLDRIAEDTPDCTESSLKMHVSNLRRKLRGVTGRDYIEAVWGIGFKLKSD